MPVVKSPRERLHEMADERWFGPYPGTTEETARGSEVRIVDIVRYLEEQRGKACPGCGAVGTHGADCTEVLHEASDAARERDEQADFPKCQWCHGVGHVTTEPTINYTRRETCAFCKGTGKSQYRIATELRRDLDLSQKAHVYCIDKINAAFTALKVAHNAADTPNEPDIEKAFRVLDDGVMAAMRALYPEHAITSEPHVVNKVREG